MKPKIGIRCVNGRFLEIGNGGGNGADVDPANIVTASGRIKTRDGDRCLAEDRGGVPSVQQCPVGIGGEAKSGGGSDEGCNHVVHRIEPAARFQKGMRVRVRTPAPADSGALGLLYGLDVKLKLDNIADKNAAGLQRNVPDQAEFLAANFRAAFKTNACSTPGINAGAQ